MDSQTLKLSGIHELFSDHVSDTGIQQRSQGGFLCHEVVCPEPRHAAKVPYFMESLTRLDSRTNCNFLPAQNGEHASKSLDILDAIRKDDDDAGEASEADHQRRLFGFSPPARMNNPVVHDALFAKENSQFPSPALDSHGAKPQERNPHSCACSFMAKARARPQGFSCSKICRDQNSSLCSTLNAMKLKSFHFLVFLPAQV